MWQFWLFHQFLTTFTIFFGNFDDFLQCWQLFTMLTNYSQCWQIIHNVDKFWQIRWSGPLIWGQTQPNPKVMWNILQLTFICVMNFAFILFLTESPLVKLGKFWPHLPSPGWTKCYLIAKSSLQFSISMKSQKIGNHFFKHFSGNHIREGGWIPPPPPSSYTNSVR